jgi:hypothetical protein
VLAGTVEVVPFALVTNVVLTVSLPAFTISISLLKLLLMNARFLMPLVFAVLEDEEEPLPQESSTLIAATHKPRLIARFKMLGLRPTAWI